MRAPAVVLQSVAIRAVVTLAFTVSLLIPSLVFPADLPVSYLVDFKTFKRGSAAIDPAESLDALTFELHTTPDCSGSPVHSEIVTAGSDNLIKAKVITQKTKEESRRPKGLRLRLVMNPPNVPGRLYLIVTGDGILPIGPSCQPQEASFDTLSALSCVTGEIPKWFGSSWACATDEDTTPALSCFNRGGSVVVPVSTRVEVTSTCNPGEIPLSAAVNWRQGFEAIPGLPCSGHIIPDGTNVKGFTWTALVGSTTLFKLFNDGTGSGGGCADIEVRCCALTP